MYLSVYISCSLFTVHIAEPVEKITKEVTKNGGEYSSIREIKK